jgi:hypothetical protein
MFRISRDGQGPVADVGQVEDIGPVVQRPQPGRFHVDEISADTLPSGHTARCWGVVIKRDNGTVVPEPR